MELSGTTFVDFVHDVYVGKDPALLTGFLNAINADAMQKYLGIQGYTAVTVEDCRKLVEARQWAMSEAAATGRSIAY